MIELTRVNSFTLLSEDIDLTPVKSLTLLQRRDRLDSVVVIDLS